MWHGTVLLLDLRLFLLKSCYVGLEGKFAHLELLVRWRNRLEVLWEVESMGLKIRLKGMGQKGI